MALTASIRKRYGDFLLDVDFTAGNGGVLALLGASGCGKSVTLRCIAGIERPDEGFVVLNGRTLFDSKKKIDLPPQQRHIGYLFQQYALFPNMTVEQNIAVCLPKQEKSRCRARITELIAMLRLEGTEKLLPRQLSGGQQQRTALARILASEPAAILLDEPFAALDSYLKWQLELELQDVLAQFSGPAVWVSHDRGEAYRNCGKVCVLDRGKSSPAVSLRELMTDPVTVSAARISGCKNYVPVRPGNGAGQLAVPDWKLSFRAAAPWREGVTTLGIRANCVHPAGTEEINSFACETVRVTEDVFSMLVMLRPEKAAQDAPLLRMELRKEIWMALPEQKQIRVAVCPEDLLLLE
ncbi:MAG: ATP-binding cassette domain-containing protein [Oscillospiraceae bacterium]|nr:ATP-binding cassette domain-containing protein [Oscillospiraceae bacterium]